MNTNDGLFFDSIQKVIVVKGVTVQTSLYADFVKMSRTALEGQTRHFSTISGTRGVDIGDWKRFTLETCVHVYVCCVEGS